ncbi:MAG: FKBP-type peptidyl-prolyl cis-trans isomerase, partial [Bacteroidota bacterium]|nr:FKBP-type peptidyl-prolyl cis-trans isomerase [Bacteroidota bacterium]
SAFSDAYFGNEVIINEEDANMLLQEYYIELSQKKSQEAISIGQAFLDENAKNEGVITTASGLQYEVINKGTGATPVESDQVTVHYHGTLVDGTVFDSSVERGQPATFPVNGVIPGWVEALQLMNVGSKYKLYIPSDLAYGERGAGGSIGPNETLIFEVELLSIN